MLKFGSRVPALFTAWDKFLVKAKQTPLSAAAPKNNIIIEKPTESRYKEILDLVTAIFMRDEPLSKKFPPCTTGKREEDFRQYAIDYLESGLSVMATDGPGGPLVGSCLNKALPREAVMGASLQEPALSEEWATIPEETFQRLIEHVPARVEAVFKAKDPNDDIFLPSVSHMLTTIHQQLDLFSAFGVDEILDVGLLSVDPKYTGRGIARRLIIESMELAACSGLQAAKTDCSGKISTHAALNAGMSIIFQLPYVNYTHSGRVVFRSIGDGNNEMTVLAARLQPKKPHVLPVNFQVPCQ